MFFSLQKVYNEFIWIEVVPYLYICVFQIDFVCVTKGFIYFLTLEEYFLKYGVKTDRSEKARGFHLLPRRAHHVLNLSSRSGCL